MLGAPTLAALLLQLAVCSDALLVSHGLEPVQDDDTQGRDTSEMMVGKKMDDGELSDFDLDDENNFAQATDEVEDELRGTGGGEEEEEQHEGSSGNDLITDVDGPFQPAVHYSEDQRKQMHSWKYAAEFVSTLNLTRARETGEVLGLQVTMSEEWEPPIVGKVRKWGLVMDWNTKQLAEGHPERQIIVGDQIFQVNKISYHHNAKTFAKRIGDQFFKTRKLTNQPTIKLYVRRKKRDEEVERRTQFQREDRHKFLYVKEWAPQMETTNVGKNWPLDSAMGWRLQYDKYWKPVVISDIKSYGLVADWNKAHPQDKIVVGDQLVQIDGYSWEKTHNSDLFVKRVHDRLHHLIQSGTTLKLGIRRPREVALALGEPLEVSHAHSSDGDGVLGGEEEEGELGNAEERKNAKEIKKAEDEDEPKVDRMRVDPRPEQAGEAELAKDREIKKEQDEHHLRQNELESESRHLPQVNQMEGKQDKRDPRFDSTGHLLPEFSNAAGDKSHVASGDAEREEAAAKAHQEVEEISCSKKFVAKLRFPKGSMKGDHPDSIMGWNLTYTPGHGGRVDEWNSENRENDRSANIGGIAGQGAVAEWNAESSERIEPGDEVLRVENVSWGGDESAFRTGIQKAIRAKLQAGVPFVAVELKRRWKEARPKGQQKESRETSAASHRSSQVEMERLPEYTEMVANVRSEMEGLASAWSTLDSKDRIAIASELFHTALKSRGAKSARSTQHSH